MLRKQSADITFFSDVQNTLNLAVLPDHDASRQLTRAAEFIAENCTRSLKLEDICEAAGLSPSHLIRAFTQRYGMTPHAYLINRRIQYSRAQLRRGRVIADVALDAGIADQAHCRESSSGWSRRRRDSIAIETVGRAASSRHKQIKRTRCEQCRHHAIEEPHKLRSLQVFAQKRACVRPTGDRFRVQPSKGWGVLKEIAVGWRYAVCERSPKRKKPGRTDRAFCFESLVGRE